MFCSKLLSLISAPLIFFFLFPQEVSDALNLEVFKKHLNNGRDFNFWSAMKWSGMIFVVS